MAELLDPQGAGNQAGAGSAGSQSAPQDGGVSVPQWLESADESLKKSLAKFKEPLAVGQAYVELEKKLGSAIQVPKADATQEEWGKFFSRIGRPESPDNYELPEGSLTDELKARIRKEAYESGATPRTVKALLGAIIDDQAAKAALSARAAEEQYTKAVSALKKELGDDYDANVELANRALKGLFPGSAQAFVDKGFGSDPALIKDLIALGKRLGEDNLVAGKSPEKKAAHPYDWMNEQFKQA
jgi:hypothetical protein